MTRRIVEAVFEVLVKFDVIEALKLVLEVEIPNMTLVLNTIGRGSLEADAICNLLSNNLQFQMGLLLKMVAGLWSLTPT